MENFTSKLQDLRTGTVLPFSRNGYWCEDDDSRLKKMFDSSCGISEIALTLGRSEVSVVGRLASMGMFAPQCRFRTKGSKQTTGDKCLCSKCQCKNCPNYKTCQNL